MAKRKARQNAERDVSEEAAAQQDSEPRSTRQPEAQPEQAAPTHNVNADSDVREGQAEVPKRPGARTWSERYIQPVKYSLYTDKDERGRRRIFIKFDLPQDHTRPEPEIISLLHAHKKDGRGAPTGLRYSFDAVQGRVWSLPDDPLGRETANNLTQELQALAEKIELGRGR